MLRPRHDIDPRLKQEKRYSLSWAKYIYEQYELNKTAINAETRAKIAINRAYADGRQDPEKYKKVFLDDPQSQPSFPVTDTATGTGKMSNAREGWVDMDFENIFSPMPKYLSNIVGIMENQEHDVVVEATDENSGALRSELKYSTLIKGMLRPLVSLVEKAYKLKLQDSETPLPKSLEEVELYANLGAFKLPYEIGQEKALGFTQTYSDQPEIKRQHIVDAVTDGYIATVAKVDPVTGLVKYERADVAELILENSKHKDYRDASYGAYPIYYTIVDFRNENPDISEEEIEKLARGVSGKYGNKVSTYTLQDDNTYTYDDEKIKVWYIVWKTVDSEYNTTRITESGEEIEVYEPYRTVKGKSIPPKVYNKENRKTQRTDLRTLYHCKWVEDSDVVFGYGKMFNLPYDFKFKDVELPIRLYRLQGKPITEGLIPILDRIQETFLKLQNDIIKAPPTGMAIEFGSLDNISLGNRKLKPFDVLRIYSQTGKLLYRLAPPEGGQNVGTQPTPFQELKGGYGEAVANAVSALAMYYQQLSIISGIDQYSSVNTTPSPEAGKAVTELAVAATGNTLKPIYSAYIKMKQDISRICALKIQAEILSYEDIQDCPYTPIIGESLVTAIQSAGDYPPVQWGFKIIAKPTDQVKQAVMESAQAALAGGKNGIPLLTYSEYLFLIEQLTTEAGIKYVRLFLAHKEGLSKKQEQAISERNIELQGQQNLMLKQAEVEKVNAETEKEIAVTKEKGKIEIALEVLKHKNKMEELTFQLANTKTENVNK